MIVRLHNFHFARFYAILEVLLGLGKFIWKMNLKFMRKEHFDRNTEFETLINWKNESSEHCKSCCSKWILHASITLFRLIGTIHDISIYRVRARSITTPLPMVTTLIWYTTQPTTQSAPIQSFLRDANLEAICINDCEFERVDCLEGCGQEVLCQSDCLRNYQTCVNGESDWIFVWPQFDLNHIGFDTFLKIVHVV